MKYIAKHEGLNRQQRNAALLGDKTSGTPNRSSAGRRMRNRAASRLDSQMRGRNKIGALLARAGIRMAL